MCQLQSPHLFTSHSPSPIQWPRYVARWVSWYGHEDLVSCGFLRTLHCPRAAKTWVSRMALTNVLEESVQHRAVHSSRSQPRHPSTIGGAITPPRMANAPAPALCRCLDRSLGDAYICTAAHCDKQTGHACEDCPPPELSHSSSSNGLTVRSPLLPQRTVRSLGR